MAIPCRHITVILPEIDALFFTLLLNIIKSEFLIQDFICGLIVNENEISVNQNLSLGVDSQKQIKF